MLPTGTVGPLGAHQLLVQPRSRRGGSTARGPERAPGAPPHAATRPLPLRAASPPLDGREPSSASCSVPEHEVLVSTPAAACVGHPAFHGRAVPGRGRAVLCLPACPTTDTRAVSTVRQSQPFVSGFGADMPSPPAAHTGAGLLRVKGSRRGFPGRPPHFRSPQPGSSARSLLTLANTCHLTLPPAAGSIQKEDVGLRWRWGGRGRCSRHAELGGLQAPRWRWGALAQPPPGSLTTRRGSPGPALQGAWVGGGNGRAGWAVGQLCPPWLRPPRWASGSASGAPCPSSLGADSGRWACPAGSDRSPLTAATTARRTR